jgi:hypothetical protein
VVLHPEAPSWLPDPAGVWAVHRAVFCDGS